MAYHLTGALMAGVFMLSVLGEVFQLRKVWHRRREQAAGRLPGEVPTAILSLNQIVSLFLAVFAFFLYAISLRPVNHYLAWPRLLSAILSIALLHELWRDRRTLPAAIALVGPVWLLAATPLVLWFQPWAQAGTVAAQSLVLVATVVLAQGYIHQILLIRRSGRTGAVSLRFHLFVLLSGLTTIAFGVAMGLAQGWPLVLLASVSAGLKSITLWHFRWVRLSPLARDRRARGPV